MTVFGNYVLLHEVKLGSLGGPHPCRTGFPIGETRQGLAQGRYSGMKMEAGVLLQPRHLADSETTRSGEKAAPDFCLEPSAGPGPPTT